MANNQAFWIKPLALLLLALGVMGTAVAQTVQDLRIGYVNPGRVSDEAPQADAARERLQREFAPRDEQIVAMQETLRALEDRLAEQRMTLDAAT